MGGASLYFWLPLLCLLSVAALFALGWLMAFIRRGKEPRGRATRIERSEPGPPPGEGEP